MNASDETKRLHARIVAAAARASTGTTPAGIYLRVSTRGQTPENQLDTVVTMLAARGYSLDPRHVFMEKESGAELDRPEMQRALAAAARGQIRAIFVWAIDRLSRDDSFAGGVREIGEFDRVGCAVLSHEETWIDSSGPFRPVFVQLALRLAADERQRKNRRTVEAVAERRRQICEGGGFWRKDRGDGRPRKYVTSWGRPRKWGEAEARALAINGERPDLTVGQIARALCAESGGRWAINKETVRSWLERAGRTFGRGSGGFEASARGAVTP